jgi:hypothetical protein
VTHDEAADSTAALTQEITALQQRQNNLVAELEQFEPSGDDDFDKAWRSGIQPRFRSILAEVKEKKTRLAKLTQQARTQPAANPALLEVIHQGHIDVRRLPEERRRRLFDAFHLELRYNDLSHDLAIRVTITGETATELDAVQALLSTPEGTDADPLRAQSGSHSAPQPKADDLVVDLQGARGGSRTRTPLRGSRF